MNIYVRVIVLAVVLQSLVGCQATMIPVHNLYNQHINRDLSQDKIQDAIKSGAISAGWHVSNISDGKMLATYNIRSHTVVVNIGYSADRYSILYHDSAHMKVKCGTRPDFRAKPNVTTGQGSCAGGASPTYIHVNYKSWIEKLNKSISAALQSACFTDVQCRG